MEKKPYFKYYSMNVNDVPSMGYITSRIDHDIWHDEDTGYFFAVGLNGVILGVDLNYEKMI